MVFSYDEEKNVTTDPGTTRQGSVNIDRMDQVYLLTRGCVKSKDGLEIASPGKKHRVRNDIATQGVLKKANVTGSRRAWAAKQLPDRSGDCFTRQKGPGSQ